MGKTRLCANIKAACRESVQVQTLWLLWTTPSSN
jgi:hypothetical protein